MLRGLLFARRGVRSTAPGGVAGRAWPTAAIPLASTATALTATAAFAAAVCTFSHTITFLFLLFYH